jgi:carbamoyltransferase
VWTEAFAKPWLGRGDKGWQGSDAMEHWEDVAWRAQHDAEEILLARARRLHEETGARNLCLAGGVALNCVANGRLVREGPFQNVWIQPAAGDDGIAIGCAYYGHLALRGGKRTFVMRHAFLGRTYDAFDRREALRPWYVRFTTRRRTPDSVAEAAAERLAAGKVLGWFQGRSEFGPRALGNRSILADPRTVAMKDHVNARVKRRQAFRPFAPAVLAERAHEIFEGDEESPFMLLCKTVRPAWRERVAVIVHIDGTARVQTVRRDDNPRLYDLIRAFDARTGVPVLLNTSFNVRGEPIVEAPLDAVECFFLCGLDVLVLDDLVLEKRWTYGAFSLVWRLLVQTRKNLRLEHLMERLAHKVLHG